MKISMVIEEKLSVYITKSKKLNPSNFQKKIKIALLSNFTLDGLNETISVKCADIQIGCNAFTGGYNQYNEEIKMIKVIFILFHPTFVFLF